MRLCRGKVFERWTERLCGGEVSFIGWSWSMRMGESGGGLRRCSAKGVSGRG